MLLWLEDNIVVVVAANAAVVGVTSIAANAVDDVANRGFCCCFIRPPNIIEFCWLVCFVVVVVVGANKVVVTESNDEEELDLEQESDVVFVGCKQEELLWQEYVFVFVVVVDGILLPELWLETLCTLSKYLLLLKCILSLLLLLQLLLLLLLQLLQLFFNMLLLLFLLLCGSFSNFCAL